MFRGPNGGRSKATATTLCQKCLKKGHYSYECKATAQERPYTSRPSRTQQLHNPKLAPKLMSDVPNDLLRKKGVADEQLAKIAAAERGRKHDRDDDGASHSPRKRSRSVSSYSSSVSTISTNRSPSPPPRKDRRVDRDTSMGSPRKPTEARKRRRKSESLSEAYSSSDEDGVRGRGDRNTRRRMSSFSPAQRGRRRSRSWSNRMDTSKSRSPVRRGRPQRASPDTRMKSRSRSFGRRRLSPVGRRMSLSRSRSQSRSRRTRRRSSPPRRTMAPKGGPRSPDGLGDFNSPGPRRIRSRSRSPFRPRDAPYAGNRNGVREDRRGLPADGRRALPQHAMGNGHAAPPPVRKERSLSPYSKRLALTQAMGR
ncbi:uncharacterized protein BDZ99DRAFT_509225 [Mytilinidion resinicola]|uniref:Zinc knuckle-domain-containing protein n=1 Tax=Mytilinidion resinicola TaxID=574789 RepID=A0A6A6YP62_9PEZI|nr:uncharacterized protein BDZ99DRAFT_509225 [Mytilinidion resinicola]KAF2809804.1 hypothetical protein BDZ99DRAFT_509225 [Mytilinidion resinicola]